MLTDTCLRYYYRVEGEGDAIITDVIYQSKTNYDEKTKGDKKQYDKLQDEIKELVEKEKFLTFKLEVINKQRTILNKFAEQICKFSDSSKVSLLYSQAVKGIVLKLVNPCHFHICNKSFSTVSFWSQPDYFLLDLDAIFVHKILFVVLHGQTAISPPLFFICDIIGWQDRI